MTTITVTAADTAQAMDKIVERLGDDALILETVKRNGRIEMVATNDPDEAQARHQQAMLRRAHQKKWRRPRWIWKSVAARPLPTCSTSR